MAKQTIKLASERQGERWPETGQHSQRVAQFEVRLHRFLDMEGQVVTPLPEFAKDPDCLTELYRAMVKTRIFDKKAISLQRRGQLGTYASSMGQEAIGAAVGSAMADDDVLLHAYREYAAQFLRGVSMKEVLLYWGGNETGMDYQKQRRDFPICVPIATQVPHAVGVAYAMKLRREKRVAVCVVGDGGTSKGDFYEAINAAGTWNLPVVFVINNNQWAISLPRKSQSRAETLAQKAIAAGFYGEQVDGNDAIAVRYCMENALEKARNGEGPTLIEALTYRLCDHTTADDASRYRSNEELAEQWRHEPLIRLRHYLMDSGYWSEAEEQSLQASCTEEIEESVKRYLETPPQPVESMFDYLYESLPDALEEQRQSAIQWSRKDA